MQLVITTNDFEAHGFIPKHAELSSYLARFGRIIFGILCGFSVFYFLYFFEAYSIQ